MATTVLMFLADSATADSATMRPVSHIQTRCLRFSSTYIHYVISALETHHSSFTEEVTKEVSSFLKSSFTYASKLLHLTLTSSSESSDPPPAETSSLSDDLLDLIASIESHLGSKHALHIVSAAKAWLPVLILGLCCDRPIKTRSNDSWLKVLSRAEAQEACGEESNEESVFGKLMLMVVHLVKKGDPKVLGSVGGMFLAGIEVGIERGDWELVLGLVHFTCVKLIGKESAGLGLMEIEGIRESLQEMYSWIERELSRGEEDLCEDGREKLESAKALLRALFVSREK